MQNKNKEILFVYLYCKDEFKIPNMQSNNRISLIYHNVARKMDYPGDELKFIRLLGEGAFGQVFLAEAYGILEDGVTTMVAVKAAGNNGTLELKEISK